MRQNWARRKEQACDEINARIILNHYTAKHLANALGQVFQEMATCVHYIWLFPPNALGHMYKGCVSIIRIIPTHSHK
jgi:hypothetical protein